MNLTEQLQKLAPLAATATAAPWRWELNAKYKHVELCGGEPKYDATVMGFARWGMGGAAPTFNIYGGMVRADEFGAEVEGRRHHASWFQDVKHPDAAFIVAARNVLTQENMALIIGLLGNMDSAMETNRVLAARLLAISHVVKDLAADNYRMFGSPQQVAKHVEKIDKILNPSK